MRDSIPLDARRRAGFVAGDAVLGRGIYLGEAHPGGAERIGPLAGGIGDRPSPAAGVAVHVGGVDLAGGISRGAAAVVGAVGGTRGGSGPVALWRAGASAPGAGPDVGG